MPPDRGHCRSCEAPILWVVNLKTGKKMPLNPRPDAEAGNVALVDGGPTAHVCSREEAVARRAGQQELYLSHFATCPNRERHRKDRPPRAGEHPCPVTVCEKIVPDTRLMCRGHWGLVSPQLQRTIYRAYRSGEGVGTPELAEAQGAAIAAVEEQL